MDASRAIAQYNAKLVPAYVSSYLTAPTGAHHATGLRRLGDPRGRAGGQIKGILALITVPAPIQMTDYILYYAFGRKITRRKRRFAGPQLSNEASYLTTFTARGLNAAALASIVAVL